MQMTLPVALLESMARIRQTCLIAVLAVMSLTVQAQDGSVACNSLIQVSLDVDCQALISPDVVLEGTYPDSISWSVEISNVTGNLVTRPGNYEVTVTNLDNGNYCWGNILVEDKLPPTVENCLCPVGNTDSLCAFLCTDLDAIQNGDMALPAPIVTDACGPMSTDTSDVVVDGACGSKILTRTLIFTDASGNSSTCVQEFRLDPVPFDDVMRPISPVQLDCGADTDPDSILSYYTPIVGLDSARRYAYPTVNGHQITTQMCNINSVYTDTETPVCLPQCSNSVKVLRRYVVLDWCNGDIDEFVQIIEAKDTTPPTVEADDVTATVDPWGCFATVIFDPPTTLHDACTDFVQYEVRAPSGVDIDYDAVLDRYVAQEVPLGTTEFYYVGSDCCDNKAIDTVQVIVQDKSSPIAVAKEHIVVSLTSANGDGQAKVFAASVDNGSHDGCTPVHIEVRRDTDNCGIEGNTTYNNDGHSNDDPDDPDHGQYVKFCCADIDQVDDFGVAFGRVKVWLRVWDDGDQDGTFGSAGDNYNETWAMVRVDDKLPPKLTCPADVTLQCFDDVDNIIQTGSATATFTCGDAAVDYVDIVDNRSDCGFGEIVRQWFIADVPSIICTQRITVEDSQLFDGTITWPMDRTTTCMEQQPDDAPTWLDTPCSSIAYSVQSDTFQFVDDVCFKVLNTYTVIDWCQFDPQDPSAGRWQRIQVIKVNDEDAPTLDMCVDTVFATNDFNDSDGDGNTCEARGLSISNSASDGGACASRQLRWKVTIDIDGNGVIDYEYTSFVSSTDNTFDDDDGNGIPDRYVAPTNSGETLTIDLPEDFDGPNSDGKIQWTVTDGCGNEAHCTTNVIVEDNKPPTPYCISLSTALMEVVGTVELWAVDFNLGSFDNCTAQEDLIYTFNGARPIFSQITQEHFFKGDGEPATAAEYAAGIAQRWLPATRTSGMVFGCESIPTADVRMTVHDLQGNSDYCDVTLTIVDNVGACDTLVGTRVAVAGSIYTEQGMPIEGASLTLETPGVELDYVTTTDVDGNYAFSSVHTGLDYSLSGEYDSNHEDGVSTLDLVLIQRHILGLRTLDSPYKVLAADINASESVSGADVVELRKLILGVTSNMPVENSWLLIDADQSFADPINPWPAQTQAPVADLSADVQKDMIAIKRGDVNGSAAGNLSIGDDLDSRSVAITLYYDEAAVDGQTTIQVKTADPVTVHGLQMSIDLGELQYRGLTAGNMGVTAQDAYMIDGVLRVSHAATQQSVLERHDVLFSIEVDANEVRLSEALSLDQSVRPEIYTGSAIQTQRIELASSRGSVTPHFALFQNQPNPFREETVIAFALPEAGSATLSIYDISGREVYKQTDSFEAGTNAITISQSLISTSGVLYYRLQSGDHVATRKMIQIQ